MGRFVEVEKIISFLKNYERFEIVKDLINRIGNLPIIVIVRCGECKCCRDELIEEYMPLYIYCEKWNHETEWDSFCSCGERIEE